MQAPFMEAQFLEMVLGHGEGRPDAPALKDDNECLSYAELSERVAAMASGLRALGVGPGDRVVLLLPNSAAFMVVALACLWAGAAFVPLSVEYPPGRVGRIVRDCHPALVVVGDGDRVVPITLAGGAPAPAIEVSKIARSPGSAPPMAHDAERDAYLIYTSGTTGEPKGVRVPERALTSAIAAATQAVGLDESARTLCTSSMHFDGAYGTALPTLMAGGLLVMPKREDLLYLRRFFSLVLEDGINHSGSSPSYLRMLLSSPRLPSLSKSALKTFGLGGEECVPSDVAGLWEVLPGLRIFNRYGPTETTIEVTTYEVSRADVGAGRIPIGAPHDGVSFTILGEEGAAVEAPHEIGELHIGGRQLMRGYWGDDELTAKVMSTAVLAGQTVYKTGDLVWRDARGLYFYAGRSDEVVKRNGVRISLTEIALALRRAPGVSGATCALMDVDGRAAIAAFVEAGGGVTVAGLRDVMTADLPASMLPDEVFIVPSLPLNPSGKVDRSRLLADAGRRPPGAGQIGPERR